MSTLRLCSLPGTDPAPSRPFTISLAFGVQLRHRGRSLSYQTSTQEHRARTARLTPRMCVLSSQETIEYMGSNIAP
jgi:hypothetical protein